MELVEKVSLLKSPNVEITVDPSWGDHCMHFKFRDKFSKETATLSTKHWSEEFDKNPGLNYTHIWDCTEMKNFEYDARDEWMETLSKYADRITSISLVSDSILIRGAARIMSKFSKLDLKVHKSIAELNSY